MSSMCRRRTARRIHTVTATRKATRPSERAGNRPKRRRLSTQGGYLLELDERELDDDELDELDDEVLGAEDVV